MIVDTHYELVTLSNIRIYIAFPIHVTINILFCFQAAGLLVT